MSAAIRNQRRLVMARAYGSAISELSCELANLDASTDAASALEVKESMMDLLTRWERAVRAIEPEPEESLSGLDA